MKYKTCVSIGEKNPKKLKIILKKALSKSDFAEIRFDYLKKSDIPIVLESSKKNLSRCVCTLRPKSEGGLFVGKEDERKSILRLIAEYNPFLLDVEFNTIQKDKKLASYLKKSKCKLLISWHDFKKTPNESQLKSRFKKMDKFSNVVKIGPDQALTAFPSYLNNRASTIYGGSDEVQRNIMAKFVLGL